ncbi:plasmid mobilization protein [Kitasatospora sp. NPDC001664]
MPDRLAPTAQQAIAWGSPTGHPRHLPSPRGGEGPGEESSEGARLLPRSPERGRSGNRGKEKLTTSPQPVEAADELKPDRRPRRRHRDTEQRAHRIVVRFNLAERDEIAAAASQREQTVSRFVATSTLAAARGQSAVGDPQDRLDRAVDELAAARAQLARVGNNLNQIAFGLNAAGYVQPADLDPTLGAVRKAVAVVDATAAELVAGSSLGA